MTARVVQLLQEAPVGLAVDPTVGGGGHAAALLAAAPHLRLLAADRDPEAVAVARRRLAAFGTDRATVVRCDLSSIPALLDERDDEVSALLLDCGLSSRQIDDPGRGFSFMKDGPLDMRADPDLPVSAAELVNGLSHDELADVIYRFGDERGLRAIAKRIVNARPLSTTAELAQVVGRGVPERFRIKTTARVFQAIRIAVNDEIDQIESTLPELVRRLVPGGRTVALTYHSIEHRAVRNVFRDLKRGRVVRTLVRSPERPERAECALNPRARSARLRAVERMRES
jgi:16S rRNA (cytosine1402-N4)-methyltransferase